MATEAAGWFREWELNSSTIEIRLIDSIMSPTPNEVWSVELDEDEGGDRIDFDVAGELLEAVRSQDEHRVAPNFTVDYKRSYTSWGGDGSWQQWIIQMAADNVGPAVLGGILYDSLKGAALDVARRIRARSEWSREPLGRDEAIQRARWHIIRKFELANDEQTHDRPSLVLVGEEERSDGSRLVRFRDGDLRYEVELVDDAGLVVIGRIGWTSES